MRCTPLARRALSAVALAASLTGVAAPTGALPAPGTEPTERPDQPDLTVSALAIAPLEGDWSVTYTVRNAGLAPAGASTATFNGGTVLTVSRSVPSLAIGATTSGSFRVPRADCYLAVVATADSGGVVRESREGNNARQVIGATSTCPPRYRVSAGSFTAIDESGIDRSGSDEPYWIFDTVSDAGSARSRASQVFGGIDTGDTQAFGIDNCLYGCGAAGATAPVGIGLSVQLWERDLGHVDQTLYDTAKAFQAAGPILGVTGAPAWVGAASTAVGTALGHILGWADDDLLGSNTYAFSAAALATALPARGSSLLDTRTYSGSGATYTLTLSISRVV